MTRTTLARFFSLLMMAFVMMAAVPAFAQEALPLPAAPAGESISNPNFVLLVAQPIFPMNNMSLYVGVPFQWTNVSATTYFLKFKIVETGEVFTLKPSYTCDPAKCTVNSLNSGVFDRTRDGQHVDWQVITKVGTTKLKSVKFSATVDELEIKAPIFPAHNSYLSMAEFTMLKFDAGHSIHLGFRLLVKDTETGKVILTRHMVYGGVECSNDECSTPISAGEKALVFEQDHTYSWQVEYISKSGETGKSPKAKFTITTN